MLLTRRALLIAATGLACRKRPDADFSAVPGVVIAHSPQSSGRYIGSPSIAALPDGTYVASHDFFGPQAGHKELATSRVYRSADRGESWEQIAEISGAFWSSLFFHRGALYLLGTNREYGDAVVRRSDDGGLTWTEPRDAASGLLLSGAGYHCAPVPVLEHQGRLWRGMEDGEGPGGWGSRFRAFVMSIPVDADLLNASNWLLTNRLPRNPDWLGGKFGGWLEGNAVAAPDGSVVDILRADYRPDGGKAAVIQVSPDGARAEFDPATGFIDFPGGCKKFTIRYDPESKLYWSLTNWVPPKHRGPRPDRVRNTVTLIASPDLRSWEIRGILLYHPDTEHHGFQYLDWLFDGADVIAVSRTAYDDGLGGAHNQHDANFMTFHRFRGFRSLTIQDSAVDPAELGA